MDPYGYYPPGYGGYGGHGHQEQRGQQGNGGQQREQQYGQQHGHHGHPGQQGQHQHHGYGQDQQHGYGQNVQYGQYGPPGYPVQHEQHQQHQQHGHGQPYGQPSEPLFMAYDRGPEDTPSPPMIEIDALLAGPGSEDGNNPPGYSEEGNDSPDDDKSSSSSDSEPDSAFEEEGDQDEDLDLDSAIEGEEEGVQSDSDEGLSGSGDDYIDEEELERRAVARAKAKEAALKLSKEGTRRSEKELKAIERARAKESAKGKGKGKKVGGGEGAGAGTKKKKVKEKGEKRDGGDAVFDMIAESVSKAASGEELGVDDTRFEEMMADINDDEDLLATGRAQKRTREHRPTPEVARLLGEANAAYATQGPAEGLEIYLQVVRHDQLIPQAWSSLASCYDELGREEAARQMRLFAAHVDRDGDKWAGLAAEFKELKQMNQCLYCLTQALRLDPSDVEALWELATIHRDQGNKLKAVKAFQRMVKHDTESANNFILLQEFYPLIQDTRQYAFGAQAYRNAFDYHLETYPGPPDPDDDESDAGEEQGQESNTMELQHILCLVDMLLQIEKLEEGVDVVRRGMRWLQGRGEQTYWDIFDDDREYTTDPKAEEAFDLDIALRHRLALLRLRLGNDSDAFEHVEEIIRLDVMAYQEMFVELGQTLMKRELWEKALECFTPLNHEESIDDEVANIYALGVCLHETARQSEAVDYFKWVIEQDPEHLEARLRLANVYEESGKKAEALEIVTDVLRRRAQQGQEKRSQPRQSRGDKAAQRTLTKRMLESQMRTTMVSLWEEVLDAERMLDDGDVGALDMFIQAAGTMIDNHRMAKHMFTRHRGVQRMSRAKFKNQGLNPGSDVLAMQDRLERSLGLEESNDGLPNTVAIRMTEFYGLSREDWLSLVVKYCCVLMAKHENEVALEILEHMVYSAIFYNRRCEIALRLALVASATRAKAYQKVADHCRRLSQMHQFRLEPILLLQSALQGGGTAAHQVWCTLALQRYVHRELRLYEDAIDGQGMSFSKRHQRWTVPPKIGISRLLDEEHFFDGGERKGDEDDDAPLAVGRKGRKSGVEPRKSVKAVSADATLGDALDEEEGMEEEEEDVEGGEDEDEESRETIRPTQVSPAWCAVYGQFLLASGSHHGALYYLIRAHEIDPYDSYICLLIAQAFFGRSMNRQSDNRNYQIAQGLAFLTKYRKLALVTRDPQTAEEVEYNYGRSFHGLGVPHLAVVHYERVLSMVQERMDQEEHDDLKDDIRRNSMAPGAAHNLMLLYAATGSMDLANEKHRWLAI